MAKRKADWRRGMGRPVTVVLFRAPLNWRFAIYLERGGVLDGGLPDEPSDGSDESAQQAMHRWIEDTFQSPVAVTWTSADQPGWWTGEISQPASSAATGG